MNRIALTKKQMDTLINAGLDVSDASLVYMGKGQYNLNKNEKYIDTLIKCKLGFYTYTLEDIYKRIDDIITLDYFLVITPVCIQLQYIKNDDSVIVSISDNGGGISSAVIERIFEPYFSTKNKKE